MLFDSNVAHLVIKGKKSDPIVCKRGLLQGSSLSPLLFNFFIDELLSELKNNGVKIRKAGVYLNNLAFADDVILIAENEVNMKNLLLICETWSLNVGMRFAPSKCVVLTDLLSTNLKLYNEPLPCSNAEKYLGVNISPDGIDFLKLAKERSDKAKGFSNMMTSLGNISVLAPEAYTRIYKSLIRPVIEYGMQLSPVSSECLKFYQGSRNSALRLFYLPLKQLL